MSETREELLNKARRACTPEFRGRLLSRGAARALTWRNGVLPSDAPPFAGGGDLDEDLSGFAYGLLRVALNLFELEERGEEARNAFDHASRALEALVTNGDPAQPIRPFHVVMAAAAAHLATFSARASSLLDRDEAVADWPVLLQAFRLLITRRFDPLFELCLGKLEEPDSKDDQLIAQWQQDEDTACSEAVILMLLEENYLRALSSFMFGVRTGEAEAHVASRERLIDGEALAQSINCVISWWVFRITRMLLDDLWQSSLHEVLPVLPEEEGRWNRMREEFIGLLASKTVAEVELWPSQLEAATRIVNDDDDLVASLPTSAGKTRIAELAILRALSQKKRIVFVTPLRALSAQTEHSLAQLFRPLRAKVSALYGGVVTSDADGEKMSEADITVCTPEKLDFALRNNPKVLDEVGLIILDEGHMLGLGEREVRYEVLIQRLLRRADAAARRIICLSAMLPDDQTRDDLVSWLRDDEKGDPIKSDWTPTRKVYGKIVWGNGRARYEVKTMEDRTFLNGFITAQTREGPRGGKKVFPDSAQKFTLACAERLLQEGRSVLIYCAQRSEVENMAKTFTKAVEDEWIKEFAYKKRKEVARLITGLHEWLGPSHPVIDALKHGLAVHHAGLPRPVLLVIDDLLRRRILKAVVASPTLAQGLNLAASCVLFHSVERFNPETAKRDPLRPEEFLNVAGRAGRAFVDVEGQVLGACFTRAQSDAWDRTVANQRRASVESGLLMAADRLLHLLMRILHRNDAGEYILNNSALWKKPALSTDCEEEERQAIEILDIALLALIGDSGQDAAHIGEVLDQVLKSSFLRRRLAHRQQRERDQLEAVIESRAHFIWSTTTAKQRKSWHLAGIGLQNGLSFKEQADELAESLAAAESAFEGGDAEGTIEGVLKFAEIAWQLDPFQPRKVHANADKVTAGWLNGETVADLTKFGEGVGEFVEDALIYRLTWAIEATRIWVNSEDEELASEDPSPLVPCIEHGSLDKTALAFLNAGLRSRRAAMVVAPLASGVKDRKTVRRWLKRDETKALMVDENFPTAETHLQWVTFADEMTGGASAVAQKQRATLQVPEGLDLRRAKCLARCRGDGVWELLGSDLRLLGVTSGDEKFAKETMWVAEDDGFGDLMASRWAHR